mgnify:FL=1|jgi:hypothetical protein
MNFKILAAAAAFCVSQSFAIIGLGFHYAPNFGTELKSTAEKEVMSLSGEVAEVGSVNLGSVKYAHGSFSNMQGFGLKLWVDILPIIDVEATYNVQFGSYDAALSLYGPEGDLIKKQKIELEFDGVPFGKASPKFVSMNGDLSITLPITSLPIIRPYIGGGITYYLSTPVLSDEFVGKFMGTAGKALLNAENMTAEEAKQLANELSDALTDEGLNTGIGGHFLVGLRAKLPIIPIAAYANYKLYFGGEFDDEIDYGRHSVEVGVGFAL